MTGNSGALLISLGFSHQTQLVISRIGGRQPRMPFDTGITTRMTILDALRRQRKSANPLGDEPYSLELQARRHQITFGRESACWKQFLDVVRSNAPKTFVLSNAEQRLKTLAGDDAAFARNFGLGRETFEELVQALDDFGARNYRIVFLSHSLREVESTARLADPRLDHRFVGILSCRSHIETAARLFAALDEPILSAACGPYDGSRKLVMAINSNVAIIYEVAAGKQSPRGSLTRLNGGFAAFFEDRDQCLTAIGTEHGLYFSNGTWWSRDSAHRISSGEIRWSSGAPHVASTAHTIAAHREAVGS